MVKINGENLEVAGMKISEYLTMAKYDGRRIVVEYNEEIIPGTAYENVILKDGDTVEILHFVGGG